MSNTIDFLKLGDTLHRFEEERLPMLIHYAPKEGGSNYSMILIENLALQGSKILLFTGYPQAKEQFYTDTKPLVQQTIVVNNTAELIKNKDKQIIIIHDDDEKLCLEAIKTLPDIKDRIIFIKNIDVCHKQLLNTYLTYNKIILSGDLDTCVAKANLSKKKYNSVILFSQPKTALPYKFIPAEKYIGYLRSSNTECYVKSTARI
ncbi:MAG: hypothetical protein NTY80_01520 [candidate division SR1 bacterium]|nr:hypothetical protein [candidate division SR1 bacterium]